MDGEKDGTDRAFRSTDRRIPADRRKASGVTHPLGSLIWWLLWFSVIAAKLCATTLIVAT